jgi:DNA ligase-associated metallophosphoesterase
MGSRLRGNERKTYPGRLNSNASRSGDDHPSVIRLAGIELLPDLSGALYIPDERTLVAADLHFEKGSSRRTQRLHLPPYDTRSTLTALTTAVARWRPERLILLGDSFHDSEGPSRADAEDLDGIDRLGGETDLIWITGNHDPELDARLPGVIASEVCLGPLTFRHAPEPGAMGEIAGHLHPVAAVVRRGRRLRCRCFAGNGERLVMPAFGAYTGGLSVLTQAFAPLFPEGRFTAWLIGRTAIHRFPGTAILP